MSRIVLGLTLCLAALACQQPSTTQAQGKGSDESVARWKGGSISSGELDALVYDQRKQALDQLLVRKLLEQKAKAENTTSEAIWKREVQDKAKPPTDAEMKALYDEQAKKQQLPPFDQIKEQIAQYLQRPALQAAQTAYVERLKKEMEVQVMLKPPRVKVAADGPSKGASGAPITIVEFSDFECPFCVKAEATVNQVMKAYEGKVRLVYRDFPLPMHSNAQKAAEAARCAGDQGKYWEMHEKLFANQRALAVDALKGYAKELKVDQAKFDKCLDSGEKAKGIEVDRKAGEQAGVTGTPAFFINGLFLNGAQPFEEFKSAIDGELAAQGEGLGAYDHEGIGAISERRKTRPVKVGAVQVGGGAPIAVQSMTTTDTRDPAATLGQIRALAEAGADIVRVAVPDAEAAAALPAIVRETPVPLVADIHFDYRLALSALSAGIHCIRLNPGNIGSRERVREVVRAARERNVPIRIGVNAGSLEEDIVAKHGWPTPEGMVESAARHIQFLEDEGYREIKVSLKAHDIAMTVKANRLFAQRFEYPLHLGITEAGTLLSGAVKSSAGLGILLNDGIGDTIRISLAADPLEEVKVARTLLKALGLKFGGATLTACPTCGRCSVGMIPIAERVESRLSLLKGAVNVAVMGCEVNGPGEASAADVGIAYGHKGVGLLFKDGKIVKRMKAEELEDALVEEAIKLSEERARAAGK